MGDWPLRGTRCWPRIGIRWSRDFFIFIFFNRVLHAAGPIAADNDKIGILSELAYYEVICTDYFGFRMTDLNTYSAAHSARGFALLSRAVFLYVDSPTGARIAGDSAAGDRWPEARIRQAGAIAPHRH